MYLGPVNVYAIYNLVLDFVRDYLWGNQAHQGSSKLHLINLWTKIVHTWITIFLISNVVLV
jgi:hypothetical protein